jgi:hypothetical protein
VGRDDCGTRRAEREKAGVMNVQRCTILDLGIYGDMKRLRVYENTR